MSGFGEFNTEKDWSDYRAALEDVFEKWGVFDYHIPAIAKVKRDGEVRVSYVHNDVEVEFCPDRWPKGYVSNWHIRSLGSIVLYLDALRKAEARGLVAGAAAAARAVAALSAPATAGSPYDVLGVNGSMGIDAVRSAYRNRLRETHPDHGGSAAEFQKVRQAGVDLGVA